MKKINITDKAAAEEPPAKPATEETKTELRRVPIGPTITLPKLNRQSQLAVVVVVVLIIAAGLLALHHKNQNSPQAQQSQITSTVNQVGKLILLPTGEQPTLAIINDASKYKNVPFFKNAANGDRLLVYAQAREAILYRPSINKIIAVAPLNPNASPTTGQ